ncbi:hypothetical protein CH373_12325 [Leptospira perolatii]|uniref:SGNH hydrolase-type esterase domain-containing protein n=1 Tax=Leptospira perolatii TaxID=2023191 RepID=A0A2M9ZLD5_9LEPT|nr:hypothetical protein [Leptospira perolatii]PJZ70277.1 hypothetical protein CH360_06645 [Leptospira perolatii]PJZ72839.1 hypothetical protein CH373_12325 [Leptospira perolatii]
MRSLMRILIVADSLGMPRKDLELEKVWTYRISEFFLNKNNIIPFLIRGGTTNNLVESMGDYLNHFKPNCVIVQLGICDCVRRGIPQRYLRVIQAIPFLSKVVRKIAKKYHYFLTKIFENRYVEPVKFRENIVSFMQAASEKKVNVYFIRIASPGNYLVRMTFNAEKDINAYNQILQNECAKYSNSKYLDPFAHKAVAEYIFEVDGHHINELGNDLVFKIVKKEIQGLHKKKA